MKNAQTIDPTKFILPVSSMKELLNTQIDLLHNLKKSIDEQSMPWVTSGVLDYDFRNRNTQYKFYYDVPLKDHINPTDNILLIIPKTFIETNNILGGEYVTVMGYFKVNLFNNQFSVKFNVIGLKLDKNNVDVSQANKLLSDLLKRITINRIHFPISMKPKIAVITPESGDAYLDFEKEILYTNYEITRYTANFLSKEQLLSKVNLIALDNTYNILVLIRGGGAAMEFSVFDDLEICQTIALVKCHKIIGIGHSSNRTLLELVVDNALQTPTAAGRYINSNIQRQNTLYKQNNIKLNSQSSKLESKIKFKQTIINILLLLVMGLGAITYYLFTNYLLKENPPAKTLYHLQNK